MAKGSHREWPDLSVEVNPLLTALYYTHTECEQRTGVEVPCSDWKSVILTGPTFEQKV